MMQQDETRRAIIAAFCRMEGEEGARLFPFLPDQEASALKKTFDTVPQGEALPREEVIDEIWRMAPVRRKSVLEEVHPGWILEKLENESPRLIGLLCRFLSGDKVRYVIQQTSQDKEMPTEFRRLPKINEAYHVAAPVLELVRDLIEKKFSFVRPQGDSFGFVHVILMKPDDLRTLFRDLGVHEVRNAFQGVDPPILRAFLSRFPPKEASEIRNRIDLSDKVPEGRRREAQKHLASLALEKLPTDELMREIGYSVFARAILSEEESWADFICQKTAPEEGYRLKRMIQEGRGRIPQAKKEEKREEILGRIFVLAEKGMIRKYWKKHSSQTHLLEDV